MWSTTHNDEDEDDDLFSSEAPGLRSSFMRVPAPVIKAVISQDNRGREIATRVQVTSSPAMNPREARWRLKPPAIDKDVHSSPLCSSGSNQLWNGEIMRKDAHTVRFFFFSKKKKLPGRE